MITITIDAVHRFLTLSSVMLFAKFFTILILLTISLKMTKSETFEASNGIGYVDMNFNM